MRFGVPEQNALYLKYREKADFLTVYIREAHARDEWPLGNTYSWDQPKTIESRLVIANQFVSEMGYLIPVVCDTITNEFNGIFSAWPERYYILLDGRLLFKAMPKIETHDFNDVIEKIITTIGM